MDNMGKAYSLLHYQGFAFGIQGIIRISKYKGLLLLRDSFLRLGVGLVCGSGVWGGGLIETNK